MKEFVAIKVWFSNERIFIETNDNRVLSQPIIYYHRLVEATDAQRADYELNHFGIHWEELDEDVSFESFEYDNTNPTELQLFFLKHREINIAEVAKKIGINSILLRNYINGLEKLSQEQEIEVLCYIHKLGEEYIKLTI